MKDVFRKDDVVTIDEEYTGQDDRITDIIVGLFKKQSGIAIPYSSIGFGRVDKTTAAHSLAKQTLNGMRKPEKHATVDDYYALVDRTVEIREKRFRNRIRKRQRNR